MLFTLARGAVLCSSQVFLDPAIKKAKASVVKTGGFRKRKPKWVRKATLQAMLPMLAGHMTGVGDLHAFAMLLVLSDAFLLRAPSEALPVRHGHGGDCIVTVEEGKVILTLARRYVRADILVNALRDALCRRVSGRISQRGACWCGDVGARTRPFCVLCTRWVLSSSSRRGESICSPASRLRRPREF